MVLHKQRLGYDKASEDFALDRKFNVRQNTNVCQNKSTLLYEHWY
jgi:hypothetical protein